MLKNLIRGIVTALGAVIGGLLGNYLTSSQYLNQYPIFENLAAKIALIATLTLILGIIFFIISSRIYSLILSANKAAEKNLSKMTIHEMFLGAAGAIVLLVITFFLTRPLNDIFPPVGSIVVVLLNILAALLGANVAIKKADDFYSFFQNIGRRSQSQPQSKDKEKESKKYKAMYKGDPKVLDTSVIIDGRIFDICQTGFIEGKLIIPSFVLEELRHIADSSDSLKRNRGRRGLDILNKIQKELDIEVEIWDKDFPEIAEVDSKLLKLATVVSGKVVTNDYNLNKVAEFQGVPVLNINELANAVKPVLLPGEEMNLLISKIGKEANQGIGYLDDGTMIVVEGGKKSIGNEIDILVTSVLQTAAGRMIFAKPKGE
ncbi:PIN/TRAM domain-containing protein [Youngiibacter fragilis]|uniref:Twitching motility protein PilT n=1 Tax=Youngiibacter fragilis 232.1 TaxID=994573 RepID=V7I3G5_9CLOT|nr:PIN/TRAM domain-containing protein [Youngiibacter fragilis]ETA79724.1 twitching motility protein PilT [Youngiibacter fragilis 232.1]